MTTTHPLFLGLGLVLLCIPAGPAAFRPAAAQGGTEAAHPAQDAKELARLIDERVRAVESVPTKQVWQDAEALVAAVKGSDAAAIDPLFDARLSRTDLSERARNGYSLEIEWNAKD